ncbi:MAG: hypothetical protein KC422_23035 [Trueperaceae bacterium]|nr:hypothetical protein [Trueperaceae bacterium]
MSYYNNNKSWFRKLTRVEDPVKIEDLSLKDLLIILGFTRTGAKSLLAWSNNEFFSLENVQFYRLKEADGIGEKGVESLDAIFTFCKHLPHGLSEQEQYDSMTRLGLSELAADALMEVAEGDLLNLAGRDAAQLYIKDHLGTSSIVRVIATLELVRRYLDFKEGQMRPIPTGKPEYINVVTS